jgi:hypothetical protein
MGARRKAPGGLTRVLFVRCDQALLDRIERARLQIERDAGFTAGQSDAARLLLDEALRERGIE